MILELEKVLRKTYLGFDERDTEFKRGFYFALKLVWTYMNKYSESVNIRMENKRLNLELDDLAHWKAQAIKREATQVLLTNQLSAALKSRNIEISEYQVEIKAKNKEINLLQQTMKNSRITLFKQKYEQKL